MHSEGPQAMGMRLYTVDLAKGLPTATDSITLYGSQILVLLPDAQHKRPPWRMSVLGDFHARKVHVRAEMSWLIDSLSMDPILAPSMKEYASKIGTVSGLVPWSLK